MGSGVGESAWLRDPSRLSTAVGQLDSGLVGPAPVAVGTGRGTEIDGVAKPMAVLAQGHAHLDQADRALGGGQLHPVSTGLEDIAGEPGR